VACFSSIFQVSKQPEKIAFFLLSENRFVFCLTPTTDQGCQMVYFQTKNPDSGKFWRALDWKLLIVLGPFVIFTYIWDILCPFGKFYAHLAYFFPVLVPCAEKNLATLRLTSLARVQTAISLSKPIQQINLSISF
jgi:hypothetical protein